MPTAYSLAGQLGSSRARMTSMFTRVSEFHYVIEVRNASEAMTFPPRHSMRFAASGRSGDALGQTGFGAQRERGEALTGSR